MATTLYHYIVTMYDRGDPEYKSFMAYAAVSPLSVHAMMLDDFPEMLEDKSIVTVITNIGIYNGETYGNT